VKVPRLSDEHDHYELVDMVMSEDELGIFFLVTVESFTQFFS